MRSQRSQLLASIAVAAIVIMAMSFFAFNAATTVVPDRGGTFVEAATGVVTTLNPLLSPGRSPDEDLTRLIFSGLMRTDGRGAIVPDLASRWELSADGRVYAFQLRPNLRWHDGTPLSTRDVMFTATLLQDDGFPGHPDVAMPWRKVSTEWIDDHTIRFRLPEPDARFVAALTLGILPRHALEGTPPGDLPRHPTAARPIGSGPFRFGSGTLDEVVLESFADYHLGQPYVQRIKFRFYLDAQQARRAVQQGEADGFGGFAAQELPRDDATVQLLSASSTNLALLTLNVGHPILADPQMRQALAIALDRPALVKAALNGWGEPATSLFPGESWIRDRSAPEPTVTADQARALVERAGWRAGPNGVRSKEGQPLALTILTTTAEDRRALAAGIADQWRAIGVQATVQVSETVALLREALIPNRYGAALVGVDLGANPDLYLLLHASQAHGVGFNFSGYGHPDLDRLVERARQAAATEPRARLLLEVDDRIRVEAPVVPLSFARYGYLVNRSVRGVTLGLVESPPDRFRNVHEWHFRTKRVFVRPGEPAVPARAS